MVVQPSCVSHEIALYETRAREAERRWRFLAEAGLLGLADQAPRVPRAWPRPLRRLARRLARARRAPIAPSA